MHQGANQRVQLQPAVGFGAMQINRREKDRHFEDYSSNYRHPQQAHLFS
jgi:hypothetical protein